MKSDLHMTTPQAIPPLIAEKLAAFARLEPEFEACFRYIEELQGERRFENVSVNDTVCYLHALWVCECKDRLLSVPHAIERYQGGRGLVRLRRWQETGSTAEVVVFLSEKLNNLDLAELSRQVEAAQAREGESPFVRRLMRGRLLLINRSMNLLHALEPLFALPAPTLLEEARLAAARYEHTPAQIEAQLRQLETPLYATIRHPALAQRNMILMNRQGAPDIAAVEAADEPASHVWQVAAQGRSQGPSAEQTIAGYVALSAPNHNNVRAVRWTDRPEPLANAPLELTQGVPQPD
jgi:hypothetical protein